MPTDESTKDFAHEKNTKAPEGTAAGGLTGGLAGGTLGWLAGIGALAIPGLDPWWRPARSSRCLPAWGSAPRSAV